MPRIWASTFSNLRLAATGHVWPPGRIAGCRDAGQARLENSSLKAQTSLVHPDVLACASQPASHHPGAQHSCQRPVAHSREEEEDDRLCAHVVRQLDGRPLARLQRGAPLGQLRQVRPHLQLHLQAGPCVEPLQSEVTRRRDAAPASGLAGVLWCCCPHCPLCGTSLVATKREGWRAPLCLLSEPTRCHTVARRRWSGIPLLPAGADTRLQIRHSTRLCRRAARQCAAAAHARQRHGLPAGRGAPRPRRGRVRAHPRPPEAAGPAGAPRPSPAARQEASAAERMPPRRPCCSHAGSCRPQSRLPPRGPGRPQVLSPAVLPTSSGT